MSTESGNFVVLFAAITWFCDVTVVVVDARVIATQLSQRIVSTRYGQLRGILVSLRAPGGQVELPAVEAYLGLEYGSVQGGDLRWMPPTTPVNRWDGIRSALKFRPVCPQPTGDTGDDESARPLKRVEILKRLRPFLERQDEECLSLNIYVPVLSSG